MKRRDIFKSPLVLLGFLGVPFFRVKPKPMRVTGGDHIGFPDVDYVEFDKNMAGTRFIRVNCFVGSHQVGSMDVKVEVTCEKTGIFKDDSFVRFGLGSPKGKKA